MSRYQALCLLLLPLTLWAFYFLLIYITQATGCRLGWHEQYLFGINALRFILIAQFTGTALLAGAVTLKIMAQAKPLAAQSAVTKIALACAAAALTATLLNFPGVFWLSLCS